MGPTRGTKIASRKMPPTTPPKIDATTRVRSTMLSMFSRLAMARAIAIIAVPANADISFA